MNEHLKGLQTRYLSLKNTQSKTTRYGSKFTSVQKHVQEQGIQFTSGHLHVSERGSQFTGGHLHVSERGSQFTSGHLHVSEAGSQFTSGHLHVQEHGSKLQIPFRWIILCASNYFLPLQQLIDRLKKFILKLILFLSFGSTIVFTFVLSLAQQRVFLFIY